MMVAHEATESNDNSMCGRRAATRNPVKARRMRIKGLLGRWPTTSNREFNSRNQRTGSSRLRRLRRQPDLCKLSPWASFLVVLAGCLFRVRVLGAFIGEYITVITGPV